MKLFNATNIKKKKKEKNEWKMINGNAKKLLLFHYNSKYLTSKCMRCKLIWCLFVLFCCCCYHCDLDSDGITNCFSPILLS